MCLGCTSDLMCVPHVTKIVQLFLKNWKKNYMQAEQLARIFGIQQAQIDHELEECFEWTCDMLSNIAPDVLNSAVLRAATCDG